MTTEQEHSQTTTDVEAPNTDALVPSPVGPDTSQNSTNSEQSFTQRGSQSQSESGDAALKDTEEQTPARIRRKFRPLRFIVGLTLTTISVSLILWVAIRVIDVHQLGGRFALALVAIVVMSSVMMLGAGFGLMATAAADFDDSEFERLIRSGKISSAEVMMADAPPTVSDNPSNRRSAA
jgi:hypothetical protein